VQSRPCRIEYLSQHYQYKRLDRAAELMVPFRLY
jgi:hypothetical protein